MMHTDFWDGLGDQDKWIPMSRVSWKNGCNNGQPISYRQEQNLYDGILSTEISWNDMHYRSTCFFNPMFRDLLVINIEYQSTTKHLDSLIHKSEQEQNCQVTEIPELADRDIFSFRIRKGSADGFVSLKVLSSPDLVETTFCKSGIEINLKQNSGQFIC
jgi:hypothetical protein